MVCNCKYSMSLLPNISPPTLFVHVLLYDLSVYRVYLKILNSFNLNSSPLSRDRVFHYVLYIEVLYRGHMDYYK